jgi:hypothetical protein
MLTRQSKASSAAPVGETATLLRALAERHDAQLSAVSRGAQRFGDV